MKNKILAILFCSALLAGGALSLVSNDKAEVAKAYADMHIAGDGDNFLLMDKSFSASESFVYTGDLNFNNGQAGGLVFGGALNQHAYVINMDRYENHIKLMEFGENNQYLRTLESCDFIGNSRNVRTQEWDFINERVRNISQVNVKVVVTVQDAHAYAEFFVEGIKRFGTDKVIDLNADGHYVGGQLGLNCFNADVTLTNVEAGHSDYSYFTEPYRNQYHLQPFAKWTNDPNALCYYDGWYHVFYQTNPFGQYWDAMFWGHARSRDLIHFEYLPICLFPSYNSDGSTSFMWSGCAVAYYPGMSDVIDSKNWFPNGNGSGLLAIFTDDRCGGPAEAQNQVIITSDDQGLTWDKHDGYGGSEDLTIYQRLKTPYPDRKIDWRDPKIIPIEKDSSGHVTVWGMTLSSYAENKGWLLHSKNLLDWYYDSWFYLPTPECIGIGVLEDEKGNEHAYLTNKSRTYLFGSLVYADNGGLRFLDEDGVNISTYTLGQMESKLKTLDFGPDSYASQSFYISDENSKYYGKDIVLNWFSGDLNASFCTGPGEYANLRKRWNGGFTTPVEYGVKTTENGLMLTQKPITVNNNDLEKTSVVNVSDLEVDYKTGNLLQDVETNVFELEASIKVKDDSPIVFRVDVGTDEYMEFGWNTTDGYYVDRTHLDDKGINTNIDWHVKYASHILGESNIKTFYVLNDNGGLEVFCEGYSIPFYFVTTASVSSNKAYFHIEAPEIIEIKEEGDENATINYLRVNAIKSAYQKPKAAGEGVLNLETNEVLLDTQLATSKFVSCWYTGDAKLEWTEISNNGEVEAIKSNYGISFKAMKPGTATYKVKADDKEETIRVTVSDSALDSDFTFRKEGVVSGKWNISSGTLIGEKLSGNGFLLAEESGSDFTYTSKFDISSGTAAALVFRAASDMSKYLVANYDTNEHVAKLWSTNGELARSGDVDVGVSNVALTVTAKGANVIVAINGNDVINYNLGEDEPLSGRFGLNVFSAKVVYKQLSIIEDEQEAEFVDADVEVDLGVSQYVSAVYNLTTNTRLEQGHYVISGDTLKIKKAYFLLLEDGMYRLKVVGSMTTIHVNVTVNKAVTPLAISDVTIELGLNVNVYIGTTPVTSVKVNGAALEASKYHVRDYVLTIDGSCFTEGENSVLVNDTVSFKVTANNPNGQITISTKSGCGGNIATTSTVLSSLSAVALVLILVSKRKNKRG